MAKLSEAIHDENGLLGYEGSIPGDQGDKEVITRDIIPASERFVVVFRCKDEEKANIIGESAYQCAVNPMVGYSQPRRYTLYEAWKIVKDHNIMLIDHPVECDCSLLMVVCVNNAGINIPAGTTTAIEEQELMKTGMFEKIEYTPMLKLKKGDIMWRPGHTGIISTGDEVGLNKTPRKVACVKSLTWFYTKPEAKAKYHNIKLPLLGKGNMIDICDDGGSSKKYEFWYAKAAGEYGFVRKDKVVLSK